MIHRMLAFVVLTTLLSSVSIVRVTSYSRVSKNGPHAYPLSQFVNGVTQSNDTSRARNEGKSLQDIPITVSPIYSTPRAPKLKPGEAVDYAPIRQPSHLDKQLLAQLNSMTYRKQSNERYTPPSIFQTGKKVRGNAGTNGGFAFAKPDVAFPQSAYDYSALPESKPEIKPPMASMNEESGVADDSKVPDFIQHSFEGPQDFSNFDGIYEGKPSSAIDYSDHLNHPPFEHDQEIIYDHIPDHHLYHHHHHDYTTEKPEMSDQRVNKRPYSYYYIGKKLWYIPLYFSIYFIIYVAALVLKSVARHKINFPANLAAAAADARGITTSQTRW